MSKNIAFLINSMAGGGAEQLVKSLLENFNNKLCKVELVCLEKNDTYKVDENIKITYLTTCNRNTSGFKKLIFLPVLAFNLYKYIKENRIEIIQSHLFRANYVNILSKCLFRSKHEVQVVNHSVISRYTKEGISGKINLFLIKLLYPFANKIISVSNIVEKDMQDLFNFKNEKKVIYNMFGIEKIQKLSEEIIEDFEFKNNKKYIISVGRLITLKRNQDLIYALSKLNENIEVLFIGDGEEKNNLINLSKKLDIYKRIHFLGWVNNPYKYMKHSNILICTSQTESFGNVIVEAMICGIPVISTRCGGPEEIINNDVDGFLVDIGDIEDLVEKINFIIDDRKKSVGFVLNSKEKIKLFSSIKIIEEYKKVLKIE